jgi:hypothetical protein
MLTFPAADWCDQIETVWTAGPIRCVFRTSPPSVRVIVELINADRIVVTQRCDTRLEAEQTAAGLKRTFAQIFDQGPIG